MTAQPVCGRGAPYFRRNIAWRSRQGAGDIADDDLAFFSTWCPAGTGIATLVKVEEHRWAIDDGFETARNELGLDHNETRSWHGWHRHGWHQHVSLGMLAFAIGSADRDPVYRSWRPHEPQ